VDRSHQDGPAWEGSSQGRGEDGDDVSVMSQRIPHGALRLRQEGAKQMLSASSLPSFMSISAPVFLDIDSRPEIYWIFSFLFIRTTAAAIASVIVRRSTKSWRGRIMSRTAFVLPGYSVNSRTDFQVYTSTSIANTLL
jgi:hypothetical protein